MGNRKSHEIDYKIHGDDMQVVEIELDPQESVVAEAGAMAMMSNSIAMTTIFGDGSGQEQDIVGKILGAGKRLLTRESLFMTMFTNEGKDKQQVFFSAPYVGKIIPMDLRTLGGKIICQKDSFLCAAKGVSVSMAFTKRIGAGFFGGEGFILQKLEGDGLAFVHAGGTIIERELQAGEVLKVDTGCLVAMTKDIDYDIKMVKGIKTMIFGGEGLFLAQLTGPGKVWIQSLPLSRLANRIYTAATAKGRGQSTEEGSVLGKLGNLFQE
jgi:uncharacterized protein (TIGR00266 family)